MIISTSQRDEQLRERFTKLTQTNVDYWSFKDDSRREHSHALFHYPAMMVPQLAHAILKQICEVHPEIERVGDPFSGSGTVLTETIRRGLSFCGADINPLAVLLCRVKAGPFLVEALSEKVLQVLARIEADQRTNVEVDFANLDKWFRLDIQIALSRIRRAILCEPEIWARRFHWIGLAEAVRYTSNSRTSTVKLHVRPKREIEDRNADAVDVFKRAITRNLEHIKKQAKYLTECGYLDGGRYRQHIGISLGDTREIRQHSLCDIILTSPPYGDNATTVTYGQYSFLPLQWIELSDIDMMATNNYLCSTHEIDRLSLGGSRRIKETDRESLSERSPALKCYLDEIKAEPADRTSRVASFFRDLDSCLSPILEGLRPGGVMVWVLGNRKVGGRRVPLDIILSELLSVHNSKLLLRLKRCISSKRMASKNNIAETISNEDILVMRKAV